MEIPFARTPRGKTSATTTQAPGCSNYGHQYMLNLRATCWLEVTYAPGVAKVDLVNPNKNDGNPSSSLVGSPVLVEGPIQSRDNDMRDTHAESTGNQDGLASELVNIQDGGDGGKEHENTADTASKQRGGVSREAQILEDEL